VDSCIGVWGRLSSPAVDELAEVAAALATFNSHNSAKAESTFDQKLWQAIESLVHRKLARDHADAFQKQRVINL
jgi:hypothetical protein